MLFYTIRIGLQKCWSCVYITESRFQQFYSDWPSLWFHAKFPSLIKKLMRDKEVNTIINCKAVHDRKTLLQGVSLDYSTTLSRLVYPTLPSDRKRLLPTNVTASPYRHMTRSGDWEQVQQTIYLGLLRQYETLVSVRSPLALSGVERLFCPSAYSSDNGGRLGWWHSYRYAFILSCTILARS